MHHLALLMSEENYCFEPCIIVGSSGSCNARIDSNEIIGVIRIEMPPSSIDFVQE